MDIDSAPQKGSKYLIVEDLDPKSYTMYVYISIYIIQIHIYIYIYIYISYVYMHLMYYFSLLFSCLRLKVSGPPGSLIPTSQMHVGAEAITRAQKVLEAATKLQQLLGPGVQATQARTKPSVRACSSAGLLPLLPRSSGDCHMGNVDLLLSK